MKTFRKVAGIAFGVLVLGACLGAGVNGIFTQVNSSNGYLVNGSGGTTSQALCSNGTFYNTPCLDYYFTIPNCSPGSADGTGDGNLGTCAGTLTFSSVGIPTQPDTNYYINCTANTTAVLPGADDWALGASVTTGVKTTSSVEYGFVVGKGSSARYPYTITADCILHHP